MKRKVCKQCKKYFDADFEGGDHRLKALALKISPSKFQEKYHKVWDRYGIYYDCGPLELVEFDEYWEQMETFLGGKI